MRTSVVFSMIGIFALGIFVGDRMNSFEGNRALAKAEDPSLAQDVVGSPGPKFSENASAHAAAPKPQTISSGNSVSVEAALRSIDDLRGSMAEKELSNSLGDDSIGLKVSRALIAGRHSDLPGAAQIAQEFQQELQKDPRAGVQILRESLGRIPQKGFEVDRITLLQSMSTLSGMQADVKDAALQEVTSNVYELPSADTATVSAENVNRASLVVTAHRLFVESAEHPEAALSGTVDAVMAQPDSAIRRTMIDRLVAKFPDQKDSLQRELAQRHLDVNSLYGVQAAAPVAPPAAQPAVEQTPAMSNPESPSPEAAPSGELQ
jgi:hypothetical protein